jgi:hypothetical protein
VSEPTLSEPTKDSTPTARVRAGMLLLAVNSVFDITIKEAVCRGAWARVTIGQFKHWALRNF